MVYRFANPRRYRGADPNAVGAALAAINAHTPEDAPRVVEAARDVNSPLHPLFEWDDTRAAARYRLLQARVLIRSVVVTRTPEEVRQLRLVARAADTSATRPLPTPTMETPEMRAERALQTVLTTYAQAPGFAPVKALLEPGDFSDEQRAARTLHAWLDEYGTLEAFAPIRAAVDDDWLDLLAETTP